MNILTTRGKVVIGGLFLLLLISTAFSSLAATILLQRNHELEERNLVLVQKCQMQQEQIVQLQNGGMK
jgi:hypothetical protein